MPSNKEIEIKLQYKNKNNIIKALGARLIFQKKTIIIDKYFSATSSSMKNSKLLLRLRIFKNKYSELTIKGKAREKRNIWHRLEATTKVDDPQVIEFILKSLGQKKISEYHSEREYWQYNNTKIDFITFTKPDMLKLMEIEGSSEKNIKSIQQKIQHLTKEVGECIFQHFDKLRDKKRKK